MPSPKKIEDITLEWLNSLFIEQGVLNSERITGLKTQPIARQGMTSLAHTVHLTYDRRPDNAPVTLLAKFSLELAAVKEAFAANRGFEREVSFYRNISKEAGIPVPHGYWAHFDAGNNACGLLLEYVDNTRATNVFSGNVEDIEQVVELLAPFHARWWNRADNLPGIYPGEADFMLDPMIEKLSTALENIKHHYRAEVGETLIALLELWLANAYEFARYEQSKPQTLCHGDLHREQILFPVAAGDPPCIIDWQLVCTDTGPIDLAHLLVSGLRPEQRQRKECELVERYHSKLVELGITGYSLDDTWESYRYGIARLALFYMTAFSIGDMAPILSWWQCDSTRSGVSFWEANCKWPSLALREHGVLDQLALQSQRSL